MDLRQIRYFLEIVRCGGFTRASEKLHVAQPSLSAAIRKLEDDLGVTLLDRREKKIAVTAEGRAFFARAEEIESLVANVELEMREMRGLERGEVRIGIPGMLAAYVFPPVIARFRELYPGLKVSVRAEGAERIRELTAGGGVDIGIVSRHRLPVDLEYLPLLKEEMVACVGRSHPYAARSSLTIRELATEPLLLFTEGFFQRLFLAEAMESEGLKPQVVFETNLVPLLVEAAARGKGVATLLRVAARQSPELAAVAFDPPLFVEAGAAWKKGGYLSAAARAFVDFLRGRDLGSTGTS